MPIMLIIPFNSSKVKGFNLSSRLDLNLLDGKIIAAFYLFYRKYLGEKLLKEIQKIAQ